MDGLGHGGTWCLCLEMWLWRENTRFCNQPPKLPFPELAPVSQSPPVSYGLADLEQQPIILYCRYSFFQTPNSFIPLTILPYLVGKILLQDNECAVTTAPGAGWNQKSPPHGNHNQFPIIWLDGAGTYLGQTKLEKFWGLSHSLIAAFCFVFWPIWNCSTDLELLHGRATAYLMEDNSAWSEQTAAGPRLCSLGASFPARPYRRKPTKWVPDGEPRGAGTHASIALYRIGFGNPPWSNHWGSAHLYPVEDYSQFLF